MQVQKKAESITRLEVSPQAILVSFIWLELKTP